jgi:hypothetical protein
MERLTWLAALILIGLAQPATVRAADVSCTNDKKEWIQTQDILLRTTDWTSSNATAGVTRPSPLKTELKLRTASSDATINLEISRDEADASIEAAKWIAAVPLGAARLIPSSNANPPSSANPPSNANPPPDAKAKDTAPTILPRTVKIISRDAKTATIQIMAPTNQGGAYQEGWQLVVALCTADGSKLLGFGEIVVQANPYWPSVLVAAVIVLAVWILLAIVSWKLHARRLQECYIAYTTRRGIAPCQAVRWAWSRWAWKAFQAINPVFISQDLLGVGSLAQFQLLIFTMAVLGVSLLVFMYTGTVPNASTDILALLGITATGTTFARIASLSKPLSTRNRTLLFGKRVVVKSASLPRLADLVANDGAIDVTKVQSLVFTVFVIVALVGNGAIDLATFALPTWITWLLGMSQGAYVAGKLVPADNMVQLNAQLDALWNAAKAAVSKQPASPEWNAFATARDAATPTLIDVFEAQFQRDKWDKLEPIDVAGL